MLGNWVDVGRWLVGAVSNFFSKCCHAVVIKVSGQRCNCKRCALGLGEVVFVVFGKVFIHGGDVVDPGPLRVGIFGVSIVDRDF